MYILIAKIRYFDKKKTAAHAFLHCHGPFLTLFQKIPYI